MWFFGLMFWLAVICFFAAAARRRRWERWAMMGPAGYGPYGRWDTREWRGLRRRDRDQAPAREGELDEQRTYIETLESRVTELEERLDFTERLLQGRREQAGTL